MVSILFIILHAICDAKMDAIKDVRVHQGIHPFGDYWHLQKHMARGALLCAGACVSIELLLMLLFNWWFMILYIGIYLAALVLIKQLIWDKVYYTDPMTWFEKDEEWQFPVNLGKFLNKILGFHN